MPEELDPTTARLVSELAASIIPPLTKSLASSMPSADFSGLFDRITRSSQDTQAHIKKSIRSEIEENRAGRSVIMQSLGNVLEDISALRRMMEKVPAPAKAKAEQPVNYAPDFSGKLNEISSRLEEIIHGLKSFGEAYAHSMEQKESDVQAVPVYSGNDARLEKLVTQSLPGLEGFVRANAKSQSQELEEFSREISTLHEQNNIALIHEVSRKVAEEIAHYGEDMLARLSEEREGQFGKIARTMKLAVMLSGAGAAVGVIALVIALFK
ncbi:MAG: hypothetical protein IJR85_02485 [Synergistaceae bacterium]|nr:hypothetical protein [Synergistaceae bacterium]